MKSKQGFSIIEVVLVLGIAGIIFLMAFIALPNLWASERDADRKSKTIEFITDLKTYQTNNSRGALPNGTSDTFTLKDAKSSRDTDNWRAFVRDYVSKDFVDPKDDPSGNGIRFYIRNCGVSNPGETCSGDPSINVVNATALSSADPDSTLYVLVGAVCDGDHAVKSSSNRDVAAVYILERTSRYCHNT